MSSKDLFKITEGAANWYFTSSNEDETYNLNVYGARVCGRSEIRDSANFLKDTLEISFPILDEIGQHFLKSPVDFVARLDLVSKDDAGIYQTEWRGTLKNVKPSRTEIKLVFNSVFSSNRSAGARPVTQRNCRHTVYGPGCSLLFDDFKVAANVTAISADGLTLTVAEAAGFANGYFNAGVIVMPDETKRYISRHSGSTLTLIRVSPSLIEEFNANGTVPVYIAPGCTQGTAWCKNTFNNLLNHGGFPNIPLKNPNGSSIV